MGVYFVALLSQGTIQSVIGQGRLFMNPKGRFTMFTGLVDNCEVGHVIRVILGLAICTSSVS